MFSIAASVCDIKKLTLASQVKKGTYLLTLRSSAPSKRCPHLHFGWESWMWSGVLKYQTKSKVKLKKKNCDQFIPNVKCIPFKNSEIIVSIFYIVYIYSLHCLHDNIIRIVDCLRFPQLAKLEKAMATHSSTLVWKIPSTEEPGRLQSMGSQRGGHDWVTSLLLLCIGEGSGNALQCSCLDYPRDSGAWWAAVYGVT